VARQVVDQAQTDYDVALAHQREVQQKRDLQARTNALEESNLRSQIQGAKSAVMQQEAALSQAEASVLPATRLQDLAAARAAVAQAKAQLTGARAGKTQDQIRKDEVTAAEAEVEQLRNQLAQLQVQQNDTTLYAPMVGVITKKYSEVGELITSAIASFGSGTPIYQVADLSTMLIKINVNEVDVAKLKAGLLTEVTIDSSRGAVFLGKIRRVAPSAAGDSATAAATASAGGVIRFPVQIQIDQADPRLKPGMSARCAMIVARRKGVLRLPVNCVKTENNKSTVLIVTDTIVDGHKAEKTTPRDVQVGLKGDDYIEVISGVNEGERVRPNPYSGPPRKAIDLDMGDGNNNNKGNG
jgi:RND family efflux transporter MFP subunit